MTTCSIGEALREDPASVAAAWRCHGPLSPLLAVSEDALVARFPYGAFCWTDGNGESHVAARREYDTVSPGFSRATFHSLDQLREAVTVKGFTVCEKHRAMCAWQPSEWRPVPGTNRLTVTERDVPPRLRLTDLLSDNEALTEAMEWAQKLGFDHGRSESPSRTGGKAA